MASPLEDMVHYLKEGGFITSKRVEEAFLKVDRAHFIPEEWRRHSYSYTDIAIPLKDGEVTISAPSVIARTFELADIKQGERILEIGTGSGYSTAICSVLVGEDGKVISVEIDEYAHNYAAEKLKEATSLFSIPNNFELFLGDGREFFYKEGFFDAVIVHAAFQKVEEAWVKQLKGNWRVVGPLIKGGMQYLARIEKESERIDIPVVYVGLK